jgi:hypothetical protein
MDLSFNGKRIFTRGNKCVCILVFLELESASASRAAEARRHGIRQIRQLRKSTPRHTINFQIAIMQSETMAAPASFAVAPMPVFE